MAEKRKLPEFYRHVITLVMGTGLAQAVNLLASPVLSRLFTPEEFALFAVFTAITGIAGVAATGRYEMAITLPAEPRRAMHLAGVALLAVSGTALLTLLGVIIGNLIWLVTDHKLHFPFSFYLLPLAVAMTGAGAVFNYWSTRHKTFRTNATARVLGALLTVSVSIVLGWFAFGTKGLIIGFTFGQTLTTLFLWYYTFRTIRRADFTKPELRAEAREYRRFPYINMPHAVVDSLQDNGIIFLMQSYFLEAVTGWYSFAFRMLKAPVGLIGAAFGQVFYQQLSVARQEGRNMRPMVLKIYLRMALIGLPGFVILYLYTPELFAFIFGEKWREAGNIAHILIPWIFLNFVASPVAGITLVCGKQREAFIITIIDSSIRFAAIIYGGITHDYTIAMQLITIFCSIILIFALGWYYYLAGQGIKHEKTDQPAG